MKKSFPFIFAILFFAGSGNIFRYFYKDIILYDFYGLQKTFDLLVLLHYKR